MRYCIVGVGLVSFLLCLCAGCKEDNPLNRQAVSGTVTFNGKPVPRGSITLVPRENPTTISGGEIKDGRFTIVGRKGVAPGEYGVSIRIPDPNWTRELAPEPKEVAPREWTTDGVHKVTVTDGGPNVFEFAVVNEEPIKY
jgi:hypothetical protein